MPVVLPAHRLSSNGWYNTTSVLSSIITIPISGLVRSTISVKRRASVMRSRWASAGSTATMITSDGVRGSVVSRESLSEVVAVSSVSHCVSPLPPAKRKSSASPSLRPHWPPAGGRVSNRSIVPVCSQKSVSTSSHPISDFISGPRTGGRADCRSVATNCCVSTNSITSNTVAVSSRQGRGAMMLH